MASSNQPGSLLRRREFLSRFLGNGMLALGGSLFGVAAAYEIYARRAQAGLSNLRRGNFRFDGRPQQSVADVAKDSPAFGPQMASQAPSTITASPETPTAAPTPPPSGDPAVFAASAPAQQSPDVTPDMLPMKINIPSIGLNGARVINVGTRIEKGVLVWETADHAVGYHIGTGVPGRPGNVVLSGHISSPIRGEGSIFHSLPSLADKIGSHVAVQTGDGTWYDYVITGTDVVTPADTWVMNTTTNAVVSLLTCVPDGVYTQRFIARGEFRGKSTT